MARLRAQTLTDTRRLLRAERRRASRHSDARTSPARHILRDGHAVKSQCARGRRLQRGGAARVLRLASGVGRRAGGRVRVGGWNDGEGEKGVGHDAAAGGRRRCCGGRADGKEEAARGG